MKYNFVSSLSAQADRYISIIIQTPNNRTMNPCLHFENNPTINEFLAAAQKLIEQGQTNPEFILSRTHTEHFIMLTASQSKSDGINQSFSFCFAENICLPTAFGERIILGHFSSPSSDVMAWWNPKTKKWMASSSQSKNSIVYLNPIELIYIYGESESGVQREQFLAGPIFLNPETGEPNRFYYPEYTEMKPTEEVRPEQLRLARWSYEDILHGCVWVPSV